jgi:Ribbon-helix-helix protein, copG family
LPSRSHGATINNGRAPHAPRRYWATQATDNHRRQEKQASHLLTAYLPADLAEAIEARARAEERSISQVIKRALRVAISDDARSAGSGREPTG